MLAQIHTCMWKRFTEIPTKLTVTAPHTCMAKNVAVRTTFGGLRGSAICKHLSVACISCMVFIENPKSWSMKPVLICSRPVDCKINLFLKITHL